MTQVSGDLKGLEILHLRTKEEMLIGKLLPFHSSTQRLHRAWNALVSRAYLSESHMRLLHCAIEAQPNTVSFCDVGRQPLVKGAVVAYWTQYAKLLLLLSRAKLNGDQPGAWASRQGRCGSKSWTGETTCEKCSSCTVVNEYKLQRRYKNFDLS